MDPSRLLAAATLALALAPPPGALAGESSSPGIPDGKEPRLTESLPVVGEARRWDLSPDLSSALETAEGRIWTHSVEIPGAAYLKLRFAEVDLEPGDRLLLKSGSGRLVEEITGHGPRNARSFWSLSVFGDRVDLQLETRSAASRPPFRITRVMVGDPAMVEQAFGGPVDRSICSPADFEDVVCYENDAAKWANVLASVGVMTAGGSVDLWCSGSNLSPEGHVLTNYHCIPATPCSSAEFVFRYYRTGCNDGSPATQDWVGYRCDETVASSPDGPCDPTPSQLDYSLNTVIGDPASTFGFVVPDPTPLSSGEEIYIVQHPAGRPHEITHGSGVDVVVDGTTLRYYDTLDTEGGSSGSPIFREGDDLLVGLHHCGGCETPGTGNRGMLMSDIHPEISEFLCSESLELTGAAPDPPEEVLGNGDGIADPGETWRVTPRLRNRSCSSDASEVTATVVEGPGSVEVQIPSPLSDFGDIPAGEVDSGSPVDFEIAPTAACGGEAVLGLSSISDSGGSHPDLDEVARIFLGQVPETVELFEDFSAGIPEDWTIVDGGTGSGEAATWTADNPGERLVLTEPFAIADSDALGTGEEMDESLVTPILDLSAYAGAFLQLEHDFRHYSAGGDEKADIDVRSEATDGTWVNAHRSQGASAAGRLTVDLTPFLASDVQIRFRYRDAVYDWWWAIDDVYVIGAQAAECSLPEIFDDGFESGDAAAWSAPAG